MPMLWLWSVVCGLWSDNGRIKNNHLLVEESNTRTAEQTSEKKVTFDDRLTNCPERTKETTKRTRGHVRPNGTANKRWRIANSSKVQLWMIAKKRSGNNR